MELDFGKLGFGFLRLPQTDDRVDLETTKEMVVCFFGGASVTSTLPTPT